MMISRIHHPLSSPYLHKRYLRNQRVNPVAVKLKMNQIIAINQVLSCTCQYSKIDCLIVITVLYLSMIGSTLQKTVSLRKLPMTCAETISIWNGTWRQGIIQLDIGVGGRHLGNVLPHSDLLAISVPVLVQSILNAPGYSWIVAGMPW